MTSFKIRRTKINNDIAMSAPQAVLCCKNCEARGGTTRKEKTTNVIFKSEAFGDPAFCKSSKRYDKLDSRAPHENDGGQILVSVSDFKAPHSPYSLSKGGALC